MKIIFLDIDGVLNDRSRDPAAESSSFDRAAVARLNRVLATTGAKLVLSSSWRYVILDGTMTLGGFDFLLRTHGMAQESLIGVTCEDEVVPGRAAQIRRWLDQHGPCGVWAAVDDHDLALGEDAWRQVRTQWELGLTDADADRLIEILGGSSA
ncbi:MAG TPA: HAD domain-containing protein [Polyangia bacterium]